MLATHGNEAVAITTNAAVAMMRLAVSAGRKAVEEILEKAQQSEASDERKFDDKPTRTELRNREDQAEEDRGAEPLRAENPEPRRTTVDVRV
jgi:hypothetical protein